MIFTAFAYGWAISFFLRLCVNSGALASSPTINCKCCLGTPKVNWEVISGSMITADTLYCLVNVKSRKLCLNTNPEIMTIAEGSRCIHGPSILLRSATSILRQLLELLADRTGRILAAAIGLDTLGDLTPLLLLELVLDIFLDLQQARLLYQLSAYRSTDPAP